MLFEHPENIFKLRDHSSIDSKRVIERDIWYI